MGIYCDSVRLPIPYLRMNGKIVEIELVADPARLSCLDLAILED